MHCAQAGGGSSAYVAQLLGGVRELFVVDAVLQHAPILVERLVAVQLGLLFLELGEALVNVRQHLADLVALLLSLVDDLERLGAAVVVDLGAGHLLEHLQTVRVQRIGQFGNLTIDSKKRSQTQPSH